MAYSFYLLHSALISHSPDSKPVLPAKTQHHLSLLCSGSQATTCTHHPDSVQLTVHSCLCLLRAALTFPSLDPMCRADRNQATPSLPLAQRLPINKCSPTQFASELLSKLLKFPLREFVLLRKTAILNPPPKAVPPKNQALNLLPTHKKDLSQSTAA